MYIIIPIIVLFSTQLIKFTIESFKNKKVMLKRLFNGSGGMPSSHSSFITSITTLIFLTEGGHSPIFGLALIFSLIVLYDAINVRFQSGLHGKHINKLYSDYYKQEIKLKEILGHNSFEIIVGTLYGILITSFIYFSFL
ncbi:MAG: divergent PAP2 family protein [Bacilli bacterium]